MSGCKALQLAHFDTSSAGTIAELRASSAEKSALLAAAEERLARLEALHSIAQACSTTHSCRTTSGIDHVERCLAIHCSIHCQTPNQRVLQDVRTCTSVDFLAAVTSTPNLFLAMKPSVLLLVLMFYEHQAKNNDALQSKRVLL